MENKKDMFNKKEQDDFLNGFVSDGEPAGDMETVKMLTHESFVNDLIEKHEQRLNAIEIKMKTFKDKIFNMYDALVVACVGGAVGASVVYIVQLF